jgi:UDP-N-acetylmuramoylalanine--D-glutamate ligase
LIIKTPGIPPTTKEIVEAKELGVVFTSQLEIFMKLCPCKTIGVTGTKGKGTTSTLIYEILRNSGEDVYLGGNIGLPAIGFLTELDRKSIVVLELSSFQLQVLSQSPNIAVVLNITSEHLNYHKSVDEYRESKSNIVKYQTTNDSVVVNADYQVPVSLAEQTNARKYFVSKKKETNGCFVNQNDEIVIMADGAEVVLAQASELLLRGRHNLENVTAASMAAFLAGARPGIIAETIKSFRGLEHRLELIAEIKSVKFYNDSFSTVPETAIAAIDSFSEPIILILGGSYKGSDYKELGKKIADSTVKAVVLIGEMAEEISKSIPETFKGERISGLTRMEDVVNKASEIAEAGDVVLLSPACASFDLFKNYKDRGEQFKYWVSELSK